MTALDWFRTLAAATCLATIPSGALAEAKPTEIPRAYSFAGAYLAAEAASIDNDLGSATTYYRQALAFDPDNREVQQDLMIALLTNGEFDDALPLAEKLKEVTEIERVSRVALAIDAMRKQNYEDARILLKLALDGDLERLMTGIMSAWTEVGLGHPDEALRIVDSLDGPEWFDLFTAYHGGLIADAAGRGPEAEERLAVALENIAGGGASPATYARIVEALASLQSRLGSKDKAMQTIARGQEVVTGAASLAAMKASIEGGATATATVSTPQQGAGEILFNLGTAINRDGAEAFSQLYLQMARVLRPGDDLILFELGGISERLEQGERAITFYRDIPDASPLKRVAMIQTGLNLADLDRHEEAKQVLQTIVDQDPKDLRGYLAYGGVLAADKQFKEASVLYEKALANLDGNAFEMWPLHYRLGIAYERTKEWPKAEAAFKKALELSPDQPDVLNYLGYSWIDMNMNLDQGLELIRKAVAARPRDGYIVDSLGWAYYRLGRYEEAVAELEQAAALMPRDATVNDHLGDAYWRVGRKLEARFQWSQVLAMEPGDVDMTVVRQKLDAGMGADAAPAIAKGPEGANAAPKPAEGAPAGDDKKTDLLRRDTTPGATSVH